ncbi:MAG: hypothetical protein ABIJ11_01960 [Elusimicrobiota bacterium]
MTANNKLKEMVDVFVESVGNLGASLGVSKVVAQLYALLYINPNPLSLDDMCETLKISKGNASMNIRYLEQWNAVKKSWQKGSRKDYYEVNPEIQKIIINRLREGVTRRLDNFIKNMEEMEKMLKSINSPGGQKETLNFYKMRFKKIKDMNNLINKFILVGEKFLT